MWLFVKHYRYLLVPLILLLLMGLSFSFGHHSGSLKMQAHYQAILLKQAEEHQQAQSAWLKQAEQISRQQLEWQKQNEHKAHELKKEIPNVMAKDRANGTDDCTFGEYSLQHYKQSLGYQ